MKICHLTSVHSYNDTRIFVKECVSLVSGGFEVHLIAPNAPDTIINGVHIHGLSTHPTNRFLRMTQTVKEVYNMALEIDAEIYHFHDPELMPIGLLLKSHDKKVIYDVHEDVPQQILTKEWIPKLMRGFVSNSVKKFEEHASNRFDAIVTATSKINQRFEKLSYKAVNINNYPLLTELYPGRIGWSQKDRVICYVGGISDIRGIIEVINAIDYANIKLLLAGKFVSSSLRDIVIKMPGWQHVEELGYLNRHEVLSVLQRSIAGIVTFHPKPNHINAQPNKMFEYMSAGIPVIASNFPLWREIIEGNHCGICVDPLNPREIAQAIQWILAHPDKAKEMGENGRRAVEKKYNWENEAKKLMLLYQTLSEI